MLRRYLPLLSLVLLAGCATTVPSQIEPPQVTLADMHFDEINLFEQHFTLVLRVRNPNNFALPMEGANLDISVNDQPFAHGMSNDHVTVPRLGEATIKVDAVSPMARVLQQLQALKQGGKKEVAYRLNGQVFISGHQSGVPVDYRGTVFPPIN